MIVSTISTYPKTSWGACRIDWTATMLAEPPVQDAASAPSAFHASGSNTAWRIRNETTKPRKMLKAVTT